MAAELGTMRVTDQIDALTTLSTNPNEISGGAAIAGGHHRVAVARGDRRHPRRDGWICRFDE